MDSYTSKQIKGALITVALSLFGLAIHTQPSMGEKSAIMPYIWLALGLISIGRIFFLLRALPVEDGKE